MGTPSNAIYHRHYPTLKRFEWAWRIVATFYSFAAWATTIPWQVLKWIAPTNLEGYLKDAENKFFEFATGPINFVQDTAYKFFNLADVLFDWAYVNTKHFYNNNLKGLEHTFEWALKNIERRVSILQDDGLSGIPKVISATDYSHTPIPGAGLVGAAGSKLVHST